MSQPNLSFIKFQIVLITVMVVCTGQKMDGAKRVNGWEIIARIRVTFVKSNEKQNNVEILLG